MLKIYFSINNIKLELKKVVIMDVDKHKIWLILGITIAIVVVGILVLAPSITEGVFGKAIAADTSKKLGDPIELTGSIGANINFGYYETLAKDPQKYIIFSGTGAKGGVIEEICLCIKIEGANYCPIYGECVYPKKTAEEYKLDVANIVKVKKENVKKINDLSSLRDKIKKYDLYLTEVPDPTDPIDPQRAVQFENAHKEIKKLLLVVDKNLLDLKKKESASKGGATR